MDPTDYEQHCATCHPLDFDPRFPGLVAPHDEPEVVHAFLLAKFTEGPPQPVVPPAQPKSEEDEGLSRLPGRRKGTIEQKEEAQEEEESPRRLPGRRVRAEGEEKEDQEEGRARLPGRRKVEEEKPSPGESIAAQVKAAERLLFKKCQECHTLESFPDKLPAVAATAIPARWMVHSVFNHRSHRLLTCTECHEKAPTSQETSDVLLPGIRVCLQCHRSKAGARTDCVECHVYHDKTKERDMNGPLAIQAVLTGAPPAAARGPQQSPSPK